MSRIALLLALVLGAWLAAPSAAEARVYRTGRTVVRTYNGTTYARTGYRGRAWGYYGGAYSRTRVRQGTYGTRYTTRTRYYR
jgi:hypothetical protein